MMTLQALVKAVTDGEEAEAIASTKKVIQEGIPVGKVIEALTAGMREIGERFVLMEIFLPEMLMASQAMQAAMRELEPEIRGSEDFSYSGQFLTR